MAATLLDLITTSKNQQDSTLILPPVNATPSMSVHIDILDYHQKLAINTQKATDIQDIANYLIGHCVICWVWKRWMVACGSNHVFFINCQQSGDAFIPHRVGWIVFKKMLKLRQFNYCVRYVYNKGSIHIVSSCVSGKREDEMCNG
jgi:hypothetical protein